MSPQSQLPPLIASTVRHVLTALAGMLVARGMMTQGSTSLVVGVVLGGIGYGWSLARAGRLGSQAMTITALLDRLTDWAPNTAGLMLISE